MKRTQKTIKICLYTILSILLVGISLTRLHAQPVYETVVGTTNQDGAWGNSMRLCANGDFLMSGYHNWHLHICRTDQMGNVMLDRAINYSPTAGPSTGNWEESYDAFEDFNGNLLTIGMTPGGPHGMHDMIVASVTPTGVLNYAQAYGSNVDDRGRFFIPDGANTLIGGETTIGDGDVYLAQINTANGAVNWSFRYDIQNLDNAWDGVLVNGNYYVCGTSRGAATNDDFYLMEINPNNGQVNWCRTYAMPGNVPDETTAITPLANGGFALCGTTGSNMLIITTDAAGNLTWARTYSGIYGYGGFERMDVMEDVHGNLIAVAATGVHAQSNGDDGIVLKTDSAGNMLWANVYSNPLSTSTDGTGFTGIVELPSCTYAVTGWYLAQYSASYDHGVLRMDVDGHTGSEIAVTPTVAVANITVTTRTPNRFAYGGVTNITTATTSTATGYARTQLVTATVQATLPISLGNDTTLCAPGPVLLDAGCPGATYAWNTGANTQQINVGTTGTYDVQVTAMGCQGYDTIVVTMHPPTTDTTNATICTGQSINVHGSPVSAAGTYTQTFTGANGCDSISTVIVTVNSGHTATATAWICEGDSILLAGQYQTSAGSYVDTIQHAGFCDTILTTTLSVAPIDSTNDSRSICQGGSTNVHGTPVTAAGTYIQTFSGSNGCDSVSTVVVTLIPSPTSSATAYICQGDSIILGGAWQTTAGNYVDTIQNAGFCDTIRTTTLVVNPTHNENDTVTTCAGGSVNIHGTPTTTPGSYTQTFNNTFGCDSVSTVTLINTPGVPATATMAICAGDSAILGGAWQTLPGAYIDTIQTPGFCDTIRTTTLVVNPTHTTFDTVTTCVGGTVIIHGVPQTVPGTYPQTFNNRFGCDSLSTVEFIHTGAVQVAAAQSICPGDSAFLQQAWQHTAGSYVDTIRNAGFCDTVRTTTLSLLQTHNEFDTVSTCAGVPVNIHGTPQINPGTYTQTFNNRFGCDSVSNVTLNVTPAIPAARNRTICLGDSAFLQQAWQTSAGTYVDTVRNVGFCDTVLTTTLILLQPDTTWDTVSTCAGVLVPIHGTPQGTPGTYTQTFNNQFGCDSVSHVTLNVTPAIPATRTVTICQGDSAIIGTTWQTIPGNYIDTIQTPGSCDTVLTTTLIVTLPVNTFDTVTTCAGVPVNIHGTPQIVPGTYTQTFANIAGCDSISNVTLIVTPAIPASRNRSICQGDSIILGGSWQTQAGTYIDTVQTTGFCDSVITTTLAITLPQVTWDTMNLCPGGTVFPHGVPVTVPGTYPQTFPRPGQCDSTSNVVVILTPVILTNATDVICSGDSAYYQGAWQKTTGNYTDTLTSLAGCDSIVITALTVTPPIADTTQVTICSGQSATIHSLIVSAPGYYTDTFKNLAGCDSISVVQLIVNPVIATQDTVTVCQGDSAIIHGFWQTAAGNYPDTFQTTAGCDSISTVTLQVNPTYFFTVNASICQGDSLILGGVWQTSAGSYYDSLQTAGGCDSVINTILTVNPTYAIANQLSICLGDSALLGGAFQTQGGVYIDSLQTAAGCDSIITTTLTIVQPSFGTTTASICQGDSILLGGIYRTTGGSYIDTLVGAAASGCDSILTTLLTIIAPSTGVDTVYICSDGVVNIGGQNISTAGTYPNIIVAGAASGCDSIVSVTVIILLDRVLHASASDTIICVGEVISLSVTGGENYDWDHGQNGAKVFAQPDVTTTYEVIDTSVCGDPTAYVTVEVLEQTVFYVPNIFSPNGDGNNDEFLIRQKGVEEFHLMIYSRWGEKVFETDDPLQAWDGRFRGQPLNTGVFVYKVEATTRCADKIDQKGEIAITR